MTDIHVKSDKENQVNHYVENENKVCIMDSFWFMVLTRQLSSMNTKSKSAPL